jgi:hypothetical protein
MSHVLFLLAGLCVGAASLIASEALATVLILEGADPSPATSAQPAMPEKTPPVDQPTDSAQSPDTPVAPAKENSAPQTSAAAPTMPTPISGASLDMANSRPANSAQLSVDMLPGPIVSVGTVVSFKVTSKKAGYLVLLDVDASGQLTQIYPNTAELTRANRADGNYIKAGGTLTIPLATDPYAGLRYVISAPNGQAMLVGILSPLPVQILDLPEIPTDIRKNPSLVLNYLAKQTSELRIPDDGNRLRETNWSFNAKLYTIQ